MGPRGETVLWGLMLQELHQVSYLNNTMPAMMNSLETSHLYTARLSAVNSQDKAKANELMAKHWSS